MRANRALIWVLATVVIIGGCGGSGATQSPDSSPTAGTTATSSAAASTSASPALSPTAGASSLYVRSWYTGVGPALAGVPLVISDGQFLTVTYAPETVEPYPIFAEPVRQAISPAGIAMIVTEAQNAGLLGAVTDFVCPHAAGQEQSVGGGPSHLLLIVQGVTHEMSGACPYEHPTPAPGGPAPGSWAAYDRFQELLADPTAWLGAELGPKIGYDPQAVAVLVAFDPEGDYGSPAPGSTVMWPLGQFATFGAGDENYRCTTVSGADAATLLPILRAATMDTVFTDSSGALARVEDARVFLPGEPNPCPVP